jgi:hypothetical protein
MKKVRLMAVLTNLEKTKSLENYHLPKYALNLLLLNIVLRSELDAVQCF